MSEANSIEMVRHLRELRDQVEQVRTTLEAVEDLREEFVQSAQGRSVRIEGFHGAVDVGLFEDLATFERNLRYVESALANLPSTREEFLQLVASLSN